jgi:uncharacterized membrane protein (DUF485 family)
MLQIALGVVAGFFAWIIVWFGSEKILSVIFPEGFGVHQRAFQEAIEKHTQFTADTSLLLVHIILGLIVSALSGFLAAWIAGGNDRAPLILGVLLLAFGVLKAVLSWRYAPIWYQLIFTVLLFPMVFAGGKLYASLH